MKAMADALFQVMYDVHGPTDSLKRLGDPLWFQALSNVLGFDWDSSGTTTVLCGVLHSILNPERHGLVAAGGKGVRSRKTPAELQDFANQLDLGEQLIRRLCYASRMTAKVDSAALQDGYQLYHHMFFLAPEYETWTVVQQGMDPETRTSRRYHWISEGLTTFIEEPHSGLFSQKLHRLVMNLTAKMSRGCRDTCVALAKEERPAAVRRQFYTIKPNPSYQETTLMKWFDFPQKTLTRIPQIYHHRVFPERMDWQAVKRIYDIQPTNFEELLAVKGVGASTVRGLALLSEMVYGEAPSWEDPVRMTFAFGGKDGVPYPVNRRAYDEAIDFLEDAIDRAKLGQKEKLHAFRRLRKFLPNPIVNQ
jgi:hypothetical protein